MLHWKATALALALAALSGALAARSDTETCTESDNRSCATQQLNRLPPETLIPIKEIDWVTVEPAGASKPVLRLLTHPTSYYVQFYHNGLYRGESMALGDAEGASIASMVRMPLVAKDKYEENLVQCKIKRRLPFLPDPTVFSAEVDLGNALGNHAETDEAGAPILDWWGADSGAVLKLKFTETEYVNEGLYETKPPVIRADALYGFFMHMISKNYDSFSKTISDVKRPVEAADPSLPEIEIMRGVVIPERDEFVRLTFVQKLGLKALLRFPENPRRNNPVRDRMLLRNIIRTKKLLSNIKEPYEGRWVAPLSDESMSRIFFSSFGMFVTEKVDGGYMANMTYLDEPNILYKEGFEPLGCAVYFDEDANITKIVDGGNTFVPGDLLWGWAKLKARTATFLLTSIEHLMQYHLLWGNIPATALRKHLPAEHEVRTAFTPHFFRTHLTCSSSQYTLVPEAGPLGRALPFQHNSGYLKILEHYVSTFKFKTYPEELAERGMEDCPFHVGATDGFALRDVMMTYVAGVFDEIYLDDADVEKDEGIKRLYADLVEKFKLSGSLSKVSLDNLKLVWGEVLFRVTGMHTAVGNAAVYAMEPFLVNFRMNTADRREVIGNWETTTVVSAITGKTIPNKYPTISDDWSELLHYRRSRAYRTLQADLVELGEEIEDRNGKRRFVNRDFHPNHTAISIFS